MDTGTLLAARWPLLVGETLLDEQAATPVTYGGEILPGIHGFVQRLEILVGRGWIGAVSCRLRGPAEP